MHWTLASWGPAHAAAFAELASASFREAYASLHAPEDLDAYCAEHHGVHATRALLADPANHCVVATDDEGPLGYYLLARTAPPIPGNDEAVELEQINLRARGYGSGLAKVLLEDCEAQARRAGAASLWLVVSDTNTRARAFYDRLGFQRIGVRPTLVVGRERLASRLLLRRISAAR